MTPELFGVALFVIAILGGGVCIAWWADRDRYELALDVEPAIGQPIDIDRLRREPGLVDDIRGKVQSVGLHRMPHGTGGRYRGASMEVTYAAFVIDTKGATHDISEGEDWAEVERDAEWLADKLDVPLQDEVYG